VVAVDLTLEGATDAREALSKALYANLFRWIVDQINLALAPLPGVAVVKLSILDIYGFECFETNGFEQLCINFANERLQQLFNRYVLAFLSPSPLPLYVPCPWWLPPPPPHVSCHALPVAMPPSLAKAHKSSTH
jgi:hypothetical protein